MKLADIKTALIEQFFDESSQGVPLLESSQVFESLRAHLKSKIDAEFQDDLGAQSSDPSKAFAQFSRISRQSTLRIVEEDGVKQSVIFAAARIGKNVSYSDLTAEDKSPKTGSLATVKQALKQAKNRNEDVIFNIATKD